MNPVRAYLFVALFWLWSAFIAVILMPPLLVLPRSLTMAAIRLWSRGLTFLLRICCDIRVEVRGREHMPTGSALVAAKHLSMFDVFGQFAPLPNACFVMKKELMWIPFFGWYCWKSQMIVVDRKGHSNALRKMVRDAKERFKDRRQFVIFPEGTRGEPGAKGDYKPGIAALYRELDLPVNPVGTNSGLYWPNKGMLPKRPGTIVFEYLEPIPPGLKRAEFMRILEERIEASSTRLLQL